MTCRSSRHRRSPGICTSRWPAACIRCLVSCSGNASTCAPTRSLVKVFSRGQLVKTHPRVRARWPFHRPQGLSGRPGRIRTAGRRDADREGDRCRTGGRHLRLEVAGRAVAVDVDADRLSPARAWSAATEQKRSTPPARGRSSLTSSTSPRSPGCSSKPVERDPIPAAKAARVAGGPSRFARDPGEFQAGNR